MECIVLISYLNVVPLCQLRVNFTKEFDFFGTILLIIRVNQLFNAMNQEIEKKFLIWNKVFINFVSSKSINNLTWFIICTLWIWNCILNLVDNTAQTLSKVDDVICKIKLCSFLLYNLCNYLLSHFFIAFDVSFIL